MNSKLPLTEAEVLSAYFELKHHRPPGWLALYFPRSDGDFEFVAMFDMSNEEDAIRLIRAVIRAYRGELIIMPADEPGEPIILTAPSAVRALSLTEWRLLYRQFADRMEAFTMGGEHPRFSKKFEALHARMKQPVDDDPDEE